MGMIQNTNTGSWQGSWETANPVQGSAHPKENLGCNNPGTGTGGQQGTVATSVGMVWEVLGVNHENTPGQVVNQGGPMNYQAPGQVWTGGPQANGLPPFLQYPNPWYLFYLHTPPMNMGPPMIPAHQTATALQQASQNNDASAKELFINTFWSMFAEEMETSAMSHGISSSGKSTKILKGVNKDSIRGFCGKTFTDKVPDIFKILNGNENITTKKQALKDKLREAQCMNAMVKFTVCKELVKEFMAHEFFSDPLESNILHGFMPFCVQKMEKKSEYALKGWEKHYNASMHMVAGDYDKKEAFLKIQLVMDAMGFISVILNTRALAWVLFTSTSLLTQDLQDLYEMVLDGYQTGELEAVGEMQPNWYAHSLWTLYKDISKFFTRRLRGRPASRSTIKKTPDCLYPRNFKV